MMRLLLVWLINTAALFAVPYLVGSVYVRNVKVALISALVLGLVNALVRPVLVLLTLPVTVLTLGLFILVINAFTFWFSANIVSGFHVNGFWSAMIGALVFSVISWALSTLLLENKE